MKKILLKMKLREIYNSVGPEMKARFEKEFGPEIFKSDVKERVRSFEDACLKLGIAKESKPERDKEPYAHHIIMCPAPNVEYIPKRFRKSLLAYYRLMVIIEALNGGWIPDFTDMDQKKYYVFAAWSRSESEDIAVYLGLEASHPGYAWTASSLGARLALKDRKTAEYAMKNFKSLYEEFFML
jgi:hypothetical protein